MLRGGGEGDEEAISVKVVDKLVLCEHGGGLFLCTFASRGQDDVPQSLKPTH